MLKIHNRTTAQTTVALRHPPFARACEPSDDRDYDRRLRPERTALKFELGGLATLRLNATSAALRASRKSMLAPVPAMVVLQLNACKMAIWRELA